MRKLATAAAVSLALASGGAFGLGLGDIEMRSALNQPMNAEIRLTSVKAGELDGMIVQLASADAFARAGIERSTALTDLRFTVDTSTGVPLIRISSQRPVVEPFLNFLLEVDWPQGRMVREYTVLLDPPVFMTPSATERNTTADQPALVQRGDEALVVPTPIDRSSTLDEADFDVELVELVEETTDNALTERQAGEVVSLDDGDLVSLDALDDSELLSDGETVSLTDGDIVSLTDLNAPNTAAIAQREAAEAQFVDIGSIEVELIDSTEEISDTTVIDGGDEAASVSPLADSAEDSTIVSLDDLDLTDDSAAGVAGNAGNEITVGNGDTLFEIAGSNVPAGVSVQQMMMALLAANESAFINSNINLVKAGSIMRIPEAEEASRLTQTQALAAVSEQNQLWQEYRDNLRNSNATRLAQGGDSGASASASGQSGNDSEAIETASIETDETLDGLSAEARAILEDARNEILNRDELRILADNAPTSTAASATSNETTDNDAQRLGEVNRKLQLAREELSSTRLQAGDLTDQASELQNTTENLDSLVSLRQNEIAQLEAQLEQARLAENEAAESDVVAEGDEAATTESTAQADDVSVEAADELIADASSVIAKAGGDAADTAGELAGDLADSATEAATDSAEAASEAASDAATAAVAGLTGVADEAANAGSNALTEAGETLEQVELLGEGEGQSATAADSEAIIAPPVKQSTWYQDFLSDPKRMVIAGIGGVGLLGVLGTLLFRRRRRDDDDSMLDIGDSEEFADVNMDGTPANDGLDMQAPGAAAAGVAAGAAGTAAIHDAMDDAMDRTQLDDTLSDKFDELAGSGLDTETDTQAFADANADESIDQDDTISEVDVYLAYGLHGQAEELLTKAIERKPEQQQYAQKLLQTYHAQGNAEGFQQAASNFHARFGGDSNPEWQNIAAMGIELNPDEALYTSAFNAESMGAGHSSAEAMGDDDFLSTSENDEMGSISRDFTSGGDAVDLEAGDEESLMDKSLDPAFAFDESDLEATGDFSQITDELSVEDDNSIDFPGFEDSAAAIADGASTGVSDNTLDPADDLMGDELLLGDLDSAEHSADDLTLDLDQLSGDLELDTSELLNADLSDLDLPDLTIDNDLLSSDSLADDGTDEMETMLDLAKAYIDMGDKDSASSALGEIVKGGSPEQVTEAESLLKNIS